MSAPSRHTACFTTLLLTLLGATHAMAGGGGHALDPAVIAAESAIGAKSVTGSRGIHLGEFRLRNYYPSEARKSSIGFICYATVAEEDLEEFRHLFIHRRNKIRDQIVVATRRVPLADYDDPELTAFRRRILLRLRRMMPELAIRDILVSEFQLTVENIY